MPCPECGVYGDLPGPGLSRWQCAKCGNGYFLRRCSACARVSYVDGLQGWRRPWPCTWCGQFNAGFRQNGDPAAASAAELAAEVARYPLAVTAAGPGTGGWAEPAPAAGNCPPPAARAAAGSGGPGPPPSGRPQTVRRSRRPLRRAALAVAVVVIGACALAAGSGAGMGGGRAASAGPAGQGGTTRAVRVIVGSVGTVDLQGVPGQLSIVGTGSGEVMLTGQLSWAGSAPVVVTRLDRAAGVLMVSVRCAPASRCTQNLRLAVPADTTAAVRQPAGRVLVRGLAGPLRLTAANAEVSASGLRSPELAAAIMSGHLSATFVTPPRRVDITLASAQATLRLPARAAYRVIRRVTSGHISVAIPEASSAAGIVTARLDSAELELLPS